MDLDHWKARFHEIGEMGGPGPALGSEELAAILREGARMSHRAVRRAFVRELVVIALVYAFAAAVVLVFGQPLRSFQLKIIILSVLGAVPVIVLFVRYLAGTRPDLGRSVLEVLDASIRRLRTVIRFYRWAGLGLATLMAAALWTDAGFRGLPPGWRWGVTAFILATAVLSIPYLQAVYGRRLGELEDLARDARGPDGGR